MNLKVNPGFATGRLQANASKSVMQRACAAAMLRKGISVIKNPGHSNDDKAALQIIESMGASVRYEGDGSIVIEGVGEPYRHLSNEETATLFCGESGLSIRMFTPLAALSGKKVLVQGSGSLVKRPMNQFHDILHPLQVQFHSNNGLLPLTVQGPAQLSNITLDGSLSSQFLTGALMMYAAKNATGKTITVNHLKSKPYIDLTLQVLSEFGFPVPENDQYQRFIFHGETKQATEEAVVYSVEGDWSGAAFLLVAGAINGNVLVKGLRADSTQADKAIVQALQMAGATMQWTDEGLQVSKSALVAFQFDATDCPDLFPPLVALASHCVGVSRFTGLKRLKHKESDRGLTLQQEFAKLGCQVRLKDDTMLVSKTEGIQKNVLQSHEDHRIAMALAVAVLTEKQPFIIQGADAVNKSYPDFWNHLRALQIPIEEVYI